MQLKLVSSWQVRLLAGVKPPLMLAKNGEVALLTGSM
jgi:hypothetical protein